MADEVDDNLPDIEIDEDDDVEMDIEPSEN
jgi:hypothetical protein